VKDWNAVFRMYMPMDVEENLGYVRNMISNNTGAPVKK
jgi:hypothetical protein